MKLSEKKRKAKIEIARIKAQLIKDGNKCFFSGQNGPYVAFHICPKGTHPEHAINPRNIVLAKREFNNIWVDRGTAKQVLTIPNVERGFVRIFEVDKLYFNKKMDMMQDNLSKEEYDSFVDLVQIEMLRMGL